MWAQVIEQPLESKIMVLRRGTSSGLIGVMPMGGQELPSSRVGWREEWKKAQKKARKKKTSEVINRSIPRRMPVSTLAVCFP